MSLLVVLNKWGWIHANDPHGYLHGEPYLEHVCKWISVDEHVCSITMHMHVNGIGHLSEIFHDQLPHK